MEQHTDRLFIRELYPTDWPRMKNIFLDFSHSQYAAYDRPLPTEDPEAQALTKRFADSGLFYAVFPDGSEEMAGYVCFHRDGDTFDLGYCFHSAYQGRGYAFESITALLQYLKRIHPGARFTAETAAENLPSCNLLERLGFIRTGLSPMSFDRQFFFQSAAYLFRPGAE